MSSWTYVNGTITVDVMGRTQPEKRYILDTVLDHLPIVTGSEGSMNVYTIQKNGYNASSSHDEFGFRTNNLIDSYGDKSRNGWLYTQDEYILVVDGSLRDMEFDETLQEFMKWLCRLAKRISIEDVMVEIRGYDEKALIRNDNDVYSNMFNSPSWSDKGSENWCEYLMWNELRDEEGNLLCGKPEKIDK